MADVELLNHSMDLPTFDGTGCVTQFLKNFLARVELFTDQDTLQCRYLKNALKNEAWNNYVLQADKLITLGDVLRWLRTEYKSSTNYRKSVHKMIFTMYQESDELVSAFATRILASWRDLFGNGWKHDSRKAQRILIPIIINNMHSSISAKFAHDFDPETVTELLDKARAIEESLIEEKNKISRKRKLSEHETAYTGETHPLSPYAAPFHAGPPYKRHEPAPATSHWPEGHYERTHYVRPRQDRGARNGNRGGYGNVRSVQPNKQSLNGRGSRPRYPP